MPELHERHVLISKFGMGDKILKYFALISRTFAISSCHVTNFTR